MKSPQPESDLRKKLQWLMFFRLLFTSLLLGSTIFFQLGVSHSLLEGPLLFIYALVAGIFLLSVVYTLLYRHIRNEGAFAFVQITADILIVTLILYVTGGFSSIFSFLYLLVLTYASLLLPRRESLIAAGLCCSAYLLLIGLEYFGILMPWTISQNMLASAHPPSSVFYKVLVNAVACFAVAMLSSYLSEQALRSKKALQVMESRMKRVEKMAFLGEMAAGMAHEIKNPLASLAGSIQMLRDDIPYDPHHDKLMRIVLRETDRLSSLVSDFLLFAKPPTGKREAIKIDSAIGDIVELFRNNGACAGRLCVTTEFNAACWVEMDPVHLRQVLWNLLLNAAEAIADSGTITVRLNARKQKWVFVQVADNGSGMAADQIKSIFTPFFTTKPQGTGLGLSIVHNILEAYGSWLEVESESGVGTTFTFRIKQIAQPRQR